MKEYLLTLLKILFMSKETLNGKDIGNEHYSMKGGHKERSDYWKARRKEGIKDNEWLPVGHYADGVIFANGNDRKLVCKDGIVLKYKFKEGGKK